MLGQVPEPVRELVLEPARELVLEPARELVPEPVLEPARAQHNWPPSSPLTARRL